MNKNIYVDVDLLNNELSKLKHEQEKLLNIKDKINQNYNQFVDLYLEGDIIEEINNNYDYGLEMTNIQIQKLNTEIDKIKYTCNTYNKTLDEITEKVGDMNA